MPDRSFFEPVEFFSALPEDMRGPYTSTTMGLAWIPMRVLRNAVAIAAFTMVFVKAPTVQTQPLVNSRIAGLDGSSTTMSTPPDTLEKVARLKPKDPRQAATFSAAASRARVVVRALQAVELSPDKIVPTSDGGVALYLFSKRTLGGGAHSRYAMFECHADGTVLLLEDREQGDVKVLDVLPQDIAAVVTRVLSFIVSA